MTGVLPQKPKFDQVWGICNSFKCAIEYTSLYQSLDHNADGRLAWESPDSLFADEDRENEDREGESREGVGQGKTMTKTMTKTKTKTKTSQQCDKNLLKPSSTTSDSMVSAHI